MPREGVTRFLAETSQSHGRPRLKNYRILRARVFGRRMLGTLEVLRAGRAELTGYWHRTRTELYHHVR